MTRAGPHAFLPMRKQPKIAAVDMESVDLPCTRRRQKAVVENIRHRWPFAKLKIIGDLVDLGPPQRLCLGELAFRSGSFIHRKKFSIGSWFAVAIRKACKLGSLHTLKSDWAMAVELFVAAS